MGNGSRLAIFWLAILALFATVSPRAAHAETTLLNQTEEPVAPKTSALAPRQPTPIRDPKPAQLSAPPDGITLAESKSVGQPGLAESLIPIWGSGRAAIDDIQNGRYLSGAFNAALAASDVFLVKAAVTAGAKLVAKGAAALARTGARKELANEGTQLGTKQAEELARAGCFVAGTMVWTANGTRPIESIEVGDLVLSRADGHEGGAVEYRPVVRTFVHEDKPLVDLGLESATGAVEHVVTTLEHPFWVHSRGFVGASDLAPGDAIETTASDGPVTRASVSETASSHLLRLVSLRSLPTRARVFNFEVEQDHTYFVGHAGAWVHNACSNRTLNFTDRDLQKGFTKHGADFGLTGNWNSTRALEYKNAVLSHINDPGVKVIEGTYRGEAVTHYLNPTTGVNVIADKAGNYISGWKLGSEQLLSVTTSGRLF